MLTSTVGFLHRTGIVKQQGTIEVITRKYRLDWTSLRETKLRSNSVMIDKRTDISSEQTNPQSQQFRAYVVPFPTGDKYEVVITYQQITRRFITALLHQPPNYRGSYQQNWHKIRFQNQNLSKNFKIKIFSFQNQNQNLSGKPKSWANSRTKLTGCSVCKGFDEVS